MNVSTIKSDLDFFKIKADAEYSAFSAVMEAAEKQGNDWGCCGFAWVTIQPVHKGNTKVGKIERHIYQCLGFSKDYNGTFQKWNAGNYGGQSMDVKEAGCIAYAKVLRQNGFEAYMQSRMD